MHCRRSVGTFFSISPAFGSEYIVFGRILARFIKFIAVLTQTSQRFLIDLIGLFPSHRIQRIRRVQRAGGIKRITGLKSASQRFRYPVRFSAGSNSPRNCRFRQRRIAIGNDRLDQLTVSRLNRILFKIIRISSGSLYKRSHRTEITNQFRIEISPQQISLGFPTGAVLLFGNRCRIDMSQKDIAFTHAFIQIAPTDITAS